MHHHAWLIFVFLAEVGFHRVGQAGLELLTSGETLTSASQSMGLQALATVPGQIQLVLSSFNRVAFEVSLRFALTAGRLSLARSFPTSVVV